MDKKELNFTYDKEVDAAYLYLSVDNEIKVVETILCEMPEESQGSINIDFDSEGRVIGIEFLNASEILKDDLLKGIMENNT